MCADVCGDCAGTGSDAGEEVIIKGDKIDNATELAPWHCCTLNMLIKIFLCYFQLLLQNFLPHSGMYLARTFRHLGHANTAVFIYFPIKVVVRVLVHFPTIPFTKTF